MNPQHIIIDAMLLDDVQAACELWYSTPELNIAQSFDTPERIAQYVRHNAGLSSVARYEEKLIGAVMCGHDGRRGSLYHAGVVPEFRRNGIARRMVDRSLQCLREAGIESAFLFTHEKNPDAQAFWKSIGWEYCSWVRYHYKSI